MTLLIEGGVRLGLPHRPLARNNCACLLAVATVCLVLAAIVGCGTSGSQVLAEGASVTFSTTYQAALRAITDLGLVPAASVCGSGVRYQTASGTWWQRVGAEAEFNANGGELVLWPTPVAAPNWPDRLTGIGAFNITFYARNTPFNCPSPRIVSGAPPTDASQFVAADQLGTYAQITFDSASESYDAGLGDVTDLGLRLADPCYEQAQTHGTTSSWHAMGQETAFADAGALVVAPTVAASADWQDQIQALSGVVSTEVPFTAQCS
jgi:hypothetical protein